jgi:hypothetical protein
MMIKTASQLMKLIRNARWERTAMPQGGIEVRRKWHSVYESLLVDAWSDCDKRLVNAIEQNYAATHAGIHTYRASGDWTFAYSGTPDRSWLTLMLT